MRLFYSRPKRPKNDNGYLEALAQSVFQAGFSWEVARNKWPHFRKVFHNFNIQKVSKMGVGEVLHLLRDPGIIRNGAKIRAVIENARIMQLLRKEHG